MFWFVLGLHLILPFYILLWTYIFYKSYVIHVFNLNVFEHLAFAFLNEKSILFKYCQLPILLFAN